MKLLVVGDDPQVLTLAYYAMMLNPDLQVDIAYTREEKPFEDLVLGLKPVHTERMLSALGTRFLHLREVRAIEYDLIVDVMSYSIEGEPIDGVEGLGTIETAIATRRGVTIYTTQPETYVDSDVYKYLVHRTGGKIRQLEGQLKLARVVYGVSHVQHPKCVHIGYGSTLRQLDVDLVVTDPVYVYKQCIHAGVLLAMNMSVADVFKAPYWRTVLVHDYVCFVHGPTAAQLVNTGRMITTIPLTIDKCYVKLSCLYRENIVGYQVAGPRGEVDKFVHTLYSAASLQVPSYLLKFVYAPSVFTGESLRTWFDSMLESALREMYWLFYTAGR